jgi:hypothetical protein
MLRRDMSAALALTIETISRQISEMRKKGGDNDAHRAR